MRDAAMTETLCRLAREAGAAILEIYRKGDIAVELKGDQSPLTAADLAADAIICAGLEAAYPGTTVVTEERAASHAGNPGHTYFLVDPLDGTKEFIHRRDEFTVNIALIENGRPVAGVVHAPALGRLFRTDEGGGAAQETDGAVAATPLVAGLGDPAALRVVASKSHRDADTDAYIARYPVGSFKSAGSSLKFCLIAAGEADLYPRLGPTMEWDTAAGHAVLAAAGGGVVCLDGKTRLLYGKAERRNPAFVAFAPGVTVL